VSCVPCVIYDSRPLCVRSLSFVLCLVYPVLSMSLDRCVCGLYHLSYVLCTLCYLCIWTVVCVVFIIRLVSCVPCVTYASGPCCIGNTGYTRHKTNDKDHTHNGPETSETQGTQDTCVVFIICLVSCVPCVTDVSGPLCVWSLSFVSCLVYPVLPMSLDRCECGLHR
jgi:hypothetical protein